MTSSIFRSSVELNAGENRFALLVHGTKHTWDPFNGIHPDLSCRQSEDTISEHQKLTLRNLTLQLMLQLDAFRRLHTESNNPAKVVPNAQCTIDPADPLQRLLPDSPSDPILIPLFSPRLKKTKAVTISSEPSATKASHQQPPRSRPP
ncbi:hypothetical protein BBP40_007069 [Aspergillus hancockii]|nr:hypothetical protein BBP40_007069 [Aspergillus hancockii]